MSEVATPGEIVREAAGRAEKLLADLRRHRAELEGTRAVADAVKVEGLRRLDEVIAATVKVLERVGGGCTAERDSSGSTGR